MLKPEHIQAAAVAARTLQALQNIPLPNPTDDGYEAYVQRWSLGRETALLYTTLFLQKAVQDINQS
jgi:hypothetical protein